MKKFSLFILALVATIVTCGYLFIINVTGEPVAVPEVLEYQANPSHDQLLLDKNEFTLLSLNLAHGRQESRHQVLLTTPQIRANLDDIITLLNREKPDIVALQEADGPSFWSGVFNHVAYMARSAGYSHSIQAANVKGMGLSYGTALLAKTVLHDPLAVTFKSAPPSLTKGFTVASVSINNDLELDLVSVHLDFFSEGVRQKQVKNMLSQLANRKRPLIIMGDFNAEWQGGSAVQLLSQELGLTTYQPTDKNLITFPAIRKRIDYILISEDFAFTSYTVLPDPVSDHRGILATIKIEAK